MPSDSVTASAPSVTMMLLRTSLVIGSAVSRSTKEAAFQRASSGADGMSTGGLAWCSRLSLKTPSSIDSTGNRKIASAEMRAAYWSKRIRSGVFIASSGKS